MNRKGVGEGGKSGGGAEAGENIAQTPPFSNYFSGSSKDAQRLMKDQWILWGFSGSPSGRTFTNASWEIPEITAGQ